MSQYGGLAKIYDKLSDHDYKLWSEYILDLASGVKNVVDAGCGTGNIAIELAKKGLNVTAIDVSEEMLNIASEKARKNGVKIVFSKQDMCKFTIHSPVDLVISTCDSINYITNPNKLMEAFKSAYNALSDAGKYIFDILSVYRYENVLGNCFFGADFEDIAYIWQNSYSEKSRLLRMDISFFVKSGAFYTKFIENHIQRAYNLDEITSALMEAGFRYIYIYDAFTLNKPREDSDRICFVAVK